MPFVVQSRNWSTQIKYRFDTALYLYIKIIIPIIIIIKAKIYDSYMYTLMCLIHSVLPAMYNNLDQSQDVSLMAQFAGDNTQK